MTVVGIRMYYHGYSDSVSGVKQNTKGEGVFTIIRIVVGIPVGIGFLAYIVWPPLMEWSQFQLDPAVRWSGLFFAIISVALLLWLQKHLSHNFTGTVMIRPKGFLVTTGPYKYVRHPMYVSFLFLGLGILLLTANWLLGGGFLFVILCVIFLRTSREEAALEKAYGEEYREYKKRTGKLFPKLF